MSETRRTIAETERFRLNSDRTFTWKSRSYDDPTPIDVCFLVIDAIQRLDKRCVEDRCKELAILSDRVNALQCQMRARVNGANINHGRVQDLINRVAALERGDQALRRAQAELHVGEGVRVDELEDRVAAVEARLSTVPLPAPVLARMLQDEAALNRLRGWIHDEVSRILEARQQDAPTEGASSPGPDDDDAEMFRRGYCAGTEEGRQRGREEGRAQLVKDVARRLRVENGGPLGKDERYTRGEFADWIEREFAGGADPEPVPHSEDAPRAFFIDLATVFDLKQTRPPSVRTTVRREHSDGRPCTPAVEVPRIPRGDRGFIGYGKDAVLGHGGEFEVYESSSIKPRVWLRSISASPATMIDETGSSLEIQLDRTGATDLRDRLQAWLDDHPEVTD